MELSGFAGGSASAERSVYLRTLSVRLEKVGETGDHTKQAIRTAFVLCRACVPYRGLDDRGPEGRKEGRKEKLYKSDLYPKLYTSYRTTGLPKVIHYSHP